MFVRHRSVRPKPDLPCSHATHVVALADDHPCNMKRVMHLIANICMHALRESGAVLHAAPRSRPSLVGKADDALAHEAAALIGSQHARLELLQSSEHGIERGRRELPSNCVHTSQLAANFSAVCQ